MNQEKWTSRENSCKSKCIHHGIPESEVGINTFVVKEEEKEKGGGGRDRGGDIDLADNCDKIILRHEGKNIQFGTLK